MKINTVLLNLNNSEYEINRVNDSDPLDDHFYILVTNF